MNKTTFIEQYALKDNNIKTLERLENIKKSVKTVKDIAIKFDYETINDECDTKSARCDYMHVMYNKHNIIECYAKKNNTLYCLVRTTVLDYATLNKSFTVEKKSEKITRVIISDSDFSKLYNTVCKAITSTTATATKKSTAKKKTASKEA